MDKPHLDPTRQEQARAYARSSRRLYFLDLALSLVFLLFLLLSGLSLKLREALPLPLPAQAASYVALLFIAYTILSFPISIYGGLILPRRYGLSHQGLGFWLSDWGKALALSLLLGAGGVALLYWLLNRYPETWWLWASGMVFLFSALLANLAPVLILPLFFNTKPLEDAELAHRLARLAERAGARVRGVFTLDFSRRGTTANAALAGLGNTRRILLSDTLISHYTPEEVEVVMAHELGHHQHRDILKLLAAQGATVLVAFYLASLIHSWVASQGGYNGAGDVAAFPGLLLLLLAFGLALRPLGNAYSRHLEGGGPLRPEAHRQPQGFHPGHGQPRIPVRGQPLGGGLLLGPPTLRKTDSSGVADAGGGQKSMKLILVRHGETDWNEARRVQGHADTELSERGRQQVEESALALAGEDIQAVYSSPLKRAVETARAIARRHGLEVQEEEGLKELDTGEMDGLSYTEMRSRFPDFMEVWARDPGPVRLPGGESLQELQKRAWLVIQRLKERHPTGIVVVVSHNFALQTILCRALGLGLVCFRRLRLDVASRSILDLSGERPSLLLLNDTCAPRRP